jgi:hypothetical protein
VADLDALAQALFAVLGSNFSVEGESLTFVSPFKLNVNMSLDPYMAKTDTNIDWLKKINFTTYEKPVRQRRRGLQRGLDRRRLLPVRQVGGDRGLQRRDEGDQRAPGQHPGRHVRPVVPGRRAGDRAAGHRAA